MDMFHSLDLKEGGWRRDDHIQHPNGVRPRVVVISTFNAKYAGIADAAKENWKAYCKHNGYALRWYPGHYHEDPTRPHTYGDKGKFEIYYDIRGQADFVMFLDIDSLFMNFSVRVDEKMRGGKKFWYTYDESGPLSGLWIAATDDATETRLRKVYEYAAMTNNVRWGKVEPNGISDQDAMRALIAVPPFRDLLQHCYPATEAGHTFPETYREGSWIIGFPGCSVAEKLALMRVWSAKERESRGVAV